jgi:predicted AlkP superfamily phosphohydrolase/phosphomutase
MNSRVLLIGLDAAEPDLVVRWAKEGSLPTMASLLETGSWARLSSPADISTGPAWPCFYSSTDPSWQGRFFFRQFKPGTYQIEKVRAHEIGVDPFWESLSESERRALIIDVPKAPVRPNTPGVHLAGWGVHSPACERSSSPPGLVHELHRRFGAYPLPNCDEFPRSDPADVREFVQRLLEGADQKAELSEYLMREKPWDLCVTVFGEPHCAGHHLWQLHDATHPDHDPEWLKEQGDPLRQVYCRVDAGVARVLKAAPDATVLLFSPHGMGPNYSGAHLLPEILARLGLAPERKGQRRNGGLARLGEAALGRVPIGLRKLVRGALPQRLYDEITCRLLALGNTWKDSRAFSIPGDFAGAIRINLKGREPAGLVERGAEYDAVCGELIRELRLLTNADTRQPAVLNVRRVDEIYSGARIDTLPDVVVNWTGEAPVRGLSSPRVGTVWGDNPDSRSGEDRSEGFLIATGPGIRPGQQLDSRQAAVFDIAPTTLRLLGASIPDIMQGRVLSELLEAGR